MSGGRKRNMALLALLVSCCGILVLLSVGGLMPVCPSKYLLGLPCPGCGGGRSASALLHGDVCGALWYNPLSVLLIFLACVSAVWLTVDIVRGRETYAALYSESWPRLWVVITVILLLANWIWNIFKYM